MEDTTPPNRHDTMTGLLEQSVDDEPNYAVTNAVSNALHALRSAQTDGELAVKVIEAVDWLDRAMSHLRQRPQRYR